LSEHCVAIAPQVACAFCGARTERFAKHPLNPNEQQEKQMKTTMYLLIVSTVGAAAAGCGDAGDGRLDEQASSSLIMNTVVAKQADGSYKRSTYYLTREQRKAEVDARYERQRLSRAGDQALTSEISNVNCNTSGSMWLYSQPNPNWSAPACCVIGGGSDAIAQLCSFQTIGALWSDDSGGLYGNYKAYCGSWFDPWQRYSSLDDAGRNPDPGCSDVDWVQLDQ
jgi:hypothetical protein